MSRQQPSPPRTTFAGGRNPFIELSPPPVRRAYDKYDKLVGGGAKQVGIDVRQRMLAAIEDCGPISRRSLSVELGLSKSGIEHHADRLIAAGLIVCEKSSGEVVYSAAAQKE